MITNKVEESPHQSEDGLVLTRTSSCRDDVGLLLFDLVAVVVGDAAVRALAARGARASLLPRRRLRLLLLLLVLKGWLLLGLLG